MKLSYFWFTGAGQQIFFQRFNLDFDMIKDLSYCISDPEEVFSFFTHKYLGEKLCQPRPI